MSKYLNMICLMFMHEHKQHVQHVSMSTCWPAEEQRGSVKDRGASRSPSAVNQQGSPRPPLCHLEHIEEHVAPTGRAAERKWSLLSNDTNFLSRIRIKVAPNHQEGSETDGIFYLSSGKMCLISDLHLRL